MEKETEEADRFTIQDAEDVRTSFAGRKLIDELRYLISDSRVQMDTVTSDGLTALQARIATLKSIITLLGEDYE